MRSSTSSPPVPMSGETAFSRYLCTEGGRAELLGEAIRVSTRRLILLEDSVPEFSLPYRVRNWAHIEDTNLDYAARSNDFEEVDPSGFRTHDGWLELLRSVPRVVDVACVPLRAISRYAHHTMFVADLEPPRGGLGPSAARPLV